MKAKRERRMMFMGVMTGAASAARGLEPTVSAIASFFQIVRAFERLEIDKYCYIFCDV